MTLTWQQIRDWLAKGDRLTYEDGSIADFEPILGSAPINTVRLGPCSILRPSILLGKTPCLEFMKTHQVRPAANPAVTATICPKADKQ